VRKDGVLVTCRHCRGAGTVPLTGEYADTYARLASLGREATGAELARLVGIKPTAMNNRLAALERLGLASSRRFGRKRFFTAVRRRE
jgi:hypothetical protein